MEVAVAQHTAEVMHAGSGPLVRVPQRWGYSTQAQFGKTPRLWLHGMGATLPATHLGAEEDGQVVLRIDDYVGTRDPSPGIAAGLHPQHPVVDLVAVTDRDGATEPISHPGAASARKQCQKRRRREERAFERCRLKRCLSAWHGNGASPKEVQRRRQQQVRTRAPTWAYCRT